LIFPFYQISAIWKCCQCISSSASYHSREKGGVENINKLIRRYIPKRTDISKLSDEFIKEIQDKFNNRPRKCLNFKTPYEIMEENKQFKYQYPCDILLEIKKHFV